MLLKQEVLTLYRRIQRLSRTWKAAIPAETNEERVYIRNEARQLFIQNKHVSDDRE